MYTTFLKAISTGRDRHVKPLHPGEKLQQGELLTRASQNLNVIMSKELYGHSNLVKFANTSKTLGEVKSTTHHLDAYIVNMDMKSCSCGKWDETKKFRMYMQQGFATQVKWYRYLLVFVILPQASIVSTAILRQGISTSYLRICS